MTGTDDQLINDYLSKLASAAAQLPADRRDELIEEIKAHIAEARAARSGATDQSSIASVLDRLGSPEQIVRAAAEQLGNDYSEPAVSQPIYRRPGAGALEISAVSLLLVGGFLAGIGWVVGAILLWISPRWRLSDKLLGTLIWPGGLAIVVVLLGLAASPGAGSTGACTATGPHGEMHCTSSPPATPGWLSLTLVIVTLIVAVGGPIVVATRLIRRANRSPGNATPDPI